MAERILAAHDDDGAGRCVGCVHCNRPAAEHPCVLRRHALHAVTVGETSGIGPEPERERTVGQARRLRDRRRRSVEVAELEADSTDRATVRAVAEVMQDLRAP